MGAAICSVAVAAISIVPAVLAILRAGNAAPNPVFDAIAAEEARMRAALERQGEELQRAQEREEVHHDEMARVAAEKDRLQQDMLAFQQEVQGEIDVAKAEAAAAEDKAKEAERKWREGIRPVVWPTTRQVEEAKRKHQYTDGLFHFAITGIAGSGKSSLLNAFRGLRNDTAGSAPTGIVETTRQTTRYPDSDARNPFVWYDIPGAGTILTPDWQYFTAHGLFVFDCIIVLFDNRFMETDIAILRNCRRFNIPAYIVRSKSNQHITNLMVDNGYDSDDEDGELREEAREQFIRETRATVEVNLKDADLPPQRVYIVSKDDLLRLVTGKRVKNLIDEKELCEDLLQDANDRRPQLGSGPGM
jgi:GTPase SAR1 family protein